MKILEDIKFNYYRNLFSSYFKENKNNEVFELFKKTSQNQPVHEKIAFEFIEHINQLNGSEIIFNKNLFWLNSFQLSDLNIIKNFLDFYFEHMNIKNFVCDNYNTLINRTNVSNYIKQITFEIFQNYPTFIQYLLSVYNSDVTKLICSSAAFFETEEKKYFINQNLTSGYIYIIKNPLTICHDLIKIHKDHDLALNQLLNLDLRPIKYTGKIEIEETICDWSTNVQSWTDPNVIDTFRGLVIKFENIIEDPIETLSEVIFHLNSSGYKLKVDHQIISKFVDQNKIFFDAEDNIEISNKIRKRMDQAINTAIKFGYSF